MLLEFSRRDTRLSRSLKTSPEKGWKRKIDVSVKKCESFEEQLSVLT